MPGSMYYRRTLTELHWFLRLLLLIGVIALIWLVVGYILPRVLPIKEVKNSQVSGILFRNERWSGEVRIVGDIWTLPGVTVTIDPGTEVVINESGDKSNLDFLPWHQRSGINIGEEYHGVQKGEPFWDESQKIQVHFSRLNAIGSDHLPIVIRSATKRPGSPFDTNVISVDKGVLSFVKMSNYRRFEINGSVVVSHSEFFTVGECAMCIEYADPTIINNVFHDVLGQDIWLLGGSPTISDNVFLSSAGSGIIMDPDQQAAPLITHNDFELPGKLAFLSLAGAEPKGADLSYNIFSGGSIIQVPCDTKVHLNQNEILGIIKLTHSGNCDGHLTLGQNYWQMTEVSSILKERVMDKEKNFALNIPNILLSKPDSVGPRQ